MKTKCALFLTTVLIAGIGCAGSTEKEVSSNEGPKIDYYKLGQEISSAAQTELLNHVKSALEKGGPVHAIKYCNVHASPLTDSLSQLYNCEISRVALKNRSPHNTPKNIEEKMLLNNMLEASLEGSMVNDTLVVNDGNLVYYKAIYIGMETCLKCHGQKGADIDNETVVALNELYPNDIATNYRMGEFRGSWKISFRPPSN